MACPVLVFAKIGQMLYDANNTIAQFLEATAARQPSPGGGSAAALAGALATAVGEMVLNYSVEKKGLEAHHQELRGVLAELRRARQLMLELMAEDQNAFAALWAARKLPKDSPDRQGQFDVALLACIRVPEAIVAAALAVLQLCDRIVQIVNPFLLSDLAVCAELAMATVRCGLHNVRVNLAEVSDAADRRKITDTIAHLSSTATEIVRRVVPRIWQRFEQHT